MLIKSETKFERMYLTSTASEVFKTFTTSHNHETYINADNLHIILSTGVLKNEKDEYFKFEVRNTCDFSELDEKQIKSEYDNILKIEQSILLSFGFRPITDTNQ